MDQGWCAQKQWEQKNVLRKSWANDGKVLKQMIGAPIVQTECECTLITSPVRCESCQYNECNQLLTDTVSSYDWCLGINVQNT